MGVRRYQDLIAWQVGDEFKLEVYRLIRESPQAQRSFRFRDQLQDSASSVTKNIIEGFLRKSPRMFMTYYFKEPDCEAAFKLARRTLTAVIRLKQSQDRYARHRDKSKGS
jgi:hypothetical protein